MEIPDSEGAVLASRNSGSSPNVVSPSLLPSGCRNPKCIWELETLTFSLCSGGSRTWRQEVLIHHISPRSHTVPPHHLLLPLHHRAQPFTPTFTRFWTSPASIPHWGLAVRGLGEKQRQFCRPLSAGRFMHIGPRHRIARNIWGHSGPQSARCSPEEGGGS